MNFKITPYPNGECDGVVLFDEKTISVNPIPSSTDIVADAPD
jgi:hypothetical protein